MIGDTVTKSLRVLRAKQARARSTLLAVCPISPAIVDANLRAAEEANAPAIFTATLNQVDIESGYTGWSPDAFVRHTKERGQLLAPNTELVFCLDHGGPWKKDQHRTAGLSFDETWSAAKRSIAHCLDAGYSWLHIDTTVDLRLSTTLPPEQIAERTAELIAYSESVRADAGRERIHYEVGVEETGSTEDAAGRFDAFLRALAPQLSARELPQPSFAVCDLGTRLDASSFVEDWAASAVEVAAKHGALVKAHFSDDLASPELYPKFGIGAANIGPGLAAREFDALASLEAKCADAGHRIGFEDTLFEMLDESGRWKKWVDEPEATATLDHVPETRRRWLLRTGARYVFHAPAVREARARLTESASALLQMDAEAEVRNHLCGVLGRLYRAFNLTDFSRHLSGP